MSLSRPTYSPLAWDATGRRHLLLSCDAEFPPFARIDETVELWWTGAGRAPERAYGHRSPDEMLKALAERLARETMGLRLYAQGPESFLWDAYGVAHAAGMGRGEVRLAHVGEVARRVFCVHCGTLSEGVRQTLATCPGCGATLFVRDHFSRRLGAYMGVQADAEAPGELAAAEAFAP